MSKNLDDLRRDRKDKATALSGVATKIETLMAAEGGADAALIGPAEAEFEVAQAAFDAADKAVKRGEAVEAAQLASAGAGDERAGGFVPGANPAVPKDPAMAGVDVGFALRALTNAKGDLARATASLDRDGHSGISAALSGASESAGGVTLPRPMAAQVIELLRPRVVMRRAGVRSMPVPAGQIRHAKQTGSAVAGYGAENGATVASEPTFGKIDQSFKTLSALVPIGNALLEHSGVGVAQMVRDDLLKVLGLREDLGFIRNDGSGDLPKGAFAWALAGQTQAAIPKTAVAAEAALRKAVSDVETANSTMMNCGWIMRPDVKNWLASLRDTNGFYLFPSIERDGTLLTYPIYTTTQIPTNLGAGTDETEVAFVDFDDMVIGDAQTITFATSTEASYVDAGGATISAYQRDMTLMRAIARHDFAPMHDTSISLINGVGWAA